MIVFSNFPDELSENDELKGNELSGSDGKMNRVLRLEPKGAYLYGGLTQLVCGIQISVQFLMNQEGLATFG